MIVAITKPLRALASQLRDRGYDVVTYGEYRHPVDAVIYSGEDSSQLFYATSNVATGTRGVLLINARDKNIAEIDKTLKSRLYSPLF